MRTTRAEYDSKIQLSICVPYIRQKTKGCHERCTRMIDMPAYQTDRGNRYMQTSRSTLALYLKYIAEVELFHTPLLEIYFLPDFIKYKFLSQIQQIEI